jgi:hypothetical protein
MGSIILQKSIASSEEKLTAREERRLISLGGSRYLVRSKIVRSKSESSEFFPQEVMMDAPGALCFE